MKSDYLRYVDDCSNKGEQPLTEQQYDFCITREWNVSKEKAIAMYTKCIREEPWDSIARLKVDGELLPWWHQPDGFREGNIKEPKKTFISSIDEIEEKIDSRGNILVTKDVLMGILTKLMEVKRESVIEYGIEYYVLNNYELDCYTELLT